MLWKPRCLGKESLEKEELAQDKKHCRKFGPCGVGEKAIYLNSFYFERRYYIPLTSVKSCLLYTSDAADDMQCVDLGGRRIIKK